MNLECIMRRSVFIAFLLVGLAHFAQGQGYEIEGRIVHKESLQAIPYATIKNLSLGKGTLSNAEGYFRMNVGSSFDTLRVSSFGYADYFLTLTTGNFFYTVPMEECYLEFESVTASPNANLYLFELLNNCTQSPSKARKKSKAYFVLKSNIAQRQIELVEEYFNADLQGYDVSDLSLKAGRVAIQSHADRFYTSLESSRAMTMFKFMEANAYFPKSPLELSKKKQRDAFYLLLKGRYIDARADSVYVIDFFPKDTSGLFFTGTVWINTSRLRFEKIALHCDEAAIHPFLPIFESDRITRVALRIVRTFTLLPDDQPIFNHTDFDYRIDYLSRAGERDQKNYTVETSAVLYTYDLSDPFLLPFFEFDVHSIGDYRKINALPYNDFFWTFHDEYGLKDSLNRNESFFNDSLSYTNKSLFNLERAQGYKLFEHPYITWTGKRVLFRDVFLDTNYNAVPEIPAQQYNLSVKIFMDINSYHDSTNIQTATIFDPYESYYHLPLTNQTHCFINMYFDLCEIKRQEMLLRIEPEKNHIARVKEIYKATLLELQTENHAFLKAVQRGENQDAMKKYNAYILEKLGVDNLQIFHPYETNSQN